MLIIAGILLLVGLDLYLSHRRMKTYGALVELNPIAREIASDKGINLSIAFLAIYNLALLVTLCYYKADTLLAILFGAKLGLCSMQLKSLQIETYIEKLLRR